MAAILGLDDDGVRAACADAAQGEVVEAVNFNAPGQVVIAGHAAAVQRAMEACKARGAKRAMPLPVSAPFHSSLMQPAAARLRERLAAVNLRAPRIPVVNNVDVQVHAHARGRITEALVRQADHPVRWVEIVQAMAAQGVTKSSNAGRARCSRGWSSASRRARKAGRWSTSRRIEQALAALKEILSIRCKDRSRW